MRGDDPRTDPLAGIPKYVRFSWPWDRLLGIYYYLFPIVSSCVFSPRSLLALSTTGRDQWKSLHVQSGLSVEVALFLRFYRPSSQQEDVDQKLHSTATVGTVCVV